MSNAWHGNEVQWQYPCIQPQQHMPLKQLVQQVDDELVVVNCMCHDGNRRRCMQTVCIAYRCRKHSGVPLGEPRQVERLPCIAHANHEASKVIVMLAGKTGGPEEGEEGGGVGAGE